MRLREIIPWSSRYDSLTEWNLEQAYLAACGGVAVDSSEFSRNARLQFTSAGISKLIEYGLSPEVPLEHVQARSNADILSKTGTLFQALCFVIQSCARWQTGLPVTLLEIHILIHVGCTLLTYLVWFRKPYAVSSPIICDHRNIRDIAALFMMSQKSRLRPGARLHMHEAGGSDQSEDITKMNSDAFVDNNAQSRKIEAQQAAVE